MIEKGDKQLLFDIYEQNDIIKEQNRIIIERLDKALAQIDTLNAVVAKINADLAQFGTDITAIGNDVSQVLALLQTAQQTGTPVDLTAAIGLLTNADANLDTLDTKVQGFNTTMQAAINTPVTPPVLTPITVTGQVTNADGSVTTTFSDGSTETELNGTITATTPPTPPATPATQAAKAAAIAAFVKK